MLASEQTFASSPTSSTTSRSAHLAMLPGAILGHAQGRVHSSGPMQPHHNFRGRFINIRDDLNQHRPQDSLFQLRWGGAIMPGARKIFSQSEQSIAQTQFERLDGEPLHFQPLLQRRLRLKRLVPTRFEFGGDQPILGVNGIVLPAGSTHFVVRLLQRQLQGFSLFVTVLASLFPCINSRFHAG